MTTVPFSFLFRDQPSNDLLSAWPETSAAGPEAGGRSMVTTTWSDPESRLRVVLETETYAGHDVTSWRARFVNDGETTLPALVDTLSVDHAWQLPATDWVIRTASGSVAVATDFEPRAFPLDDGGFRSFGPDGGRSTDGVDGAWPYFNVDAGDSGVILALGWPGQWAAELSRDGGALRMRGGVATLTLPADHRLTGDALTRVSLAPGEEIETPWMAALTWSGGDWIDAQNAWRRWMVAHVLPPANGAPIRPLAPAQANDYFVGQTDTVHDEIAWIEAYGAHGSTTTAGGVHDHWWIDAGWYDTPEWPDPVTAWVPIGTWEPHPERFPEGLAPATARAHELGMRTIVWFEPERVMPGTWLYDERPQWLLGPVEGYPHFDSKAALLDFGDDEALAWAIAHFDGLLTSQSIDVYREDFNISPLQFWNDSEHDGERGHRQIRYILGHLRFWRTLIERHPGLLIDNCASGGRRMDLLSASLSVPLLRSDWVHDATGNQTHTFGASFWAPFTGTGVHAAGDHLDYRARSGMAPSFLFTVDAREGDADWAGVNRLMAEWADVNDAYLGDYYPLTPYSADEGDSLAYQFHAGDHGFVQAFRRIGCPDATLTVALRGLGARVYELRDHAAGRTWRVDAGDLAALVIDLPEAPSATTIGYRAIG